MRQVEHALLGPVSHALSHPPTLSGELFNTNKDGRGGSHVDNSAEKWTVDHLTSSILAAHLWTGTLQSTGRVLQREPVILCNVTHTDGLPYPQEIKRAERHYHLCLRDTDLFTVSWFQTIHLSQPRWITLWNKTTLLLRCQSTTDGRF